MITYFKLYESKLCSRIRTNQHDIIHKVLNVPLRVSILKLAKASSSTETSHLSYTTSYKKADSFQITSVDSCNSTRIVVVIASIQTSKEHRNSAPIMPSRWQASYKCSYCNKEYTTVHLLNSNDEKQRHCNCPCCGTYNTPKTICKKTK